MNPPQQSRDTVDAPDVQAPARAIDWMAVLPWALLLFLATLLHGAGLWVPFVWDDLQLVQANPALREPWRLLVMPLFPDAGAGNYYRPLPFLLYAIAGELFGFESAVPFQAVQLLVVLAVAGLTYHVACRLFPPVVAWLVAALVIVFPTSIEAAAWLSALPDVVVFGFTLLFVLRYWKEVEAAKPSGILLLIFLGALLSKESGVALLPLALMLDWPRIRKDGFGRLLRFHGPFLVVMVGFLVVRSFIVPVSPAFQPDAVLPLKTIGAYAVKLVYPWPLAILLEDRTPDFDWRVLVGLGMVAVVGYGILFSASTRIRLACALLVTGVLPYLNLWRPFGEPYLIAERYMLPMAFGAAILLATLLTRVPRRVGYGILLALVLFYIPSGWARYQTWHDPAALWAAQAETHPEKIRPYMHLAQVHYEAGRMDEAVGAVEEAFRRWQDYQDTYVVRVDPGFLYGLHHAAWRVYGGAGELRKSLRHAEEAYEARPHPEAMKARIQLHDQMLDYDRALTLAYESVSRFGDYPDIVALATGYAVIGGRWDVVASMAEQSALPLRQYADQLATEFSDLDELGPFERGMRIYEETGIVSLAFRNFHASAPDLTGEQAAAVARLAFAQHLYSQSVSFYERALGLQPHIEWVRELAVALIADGRIEEGCARLEDAGHEPALTDPSRIRWLDRCSE